MEKKEPIILKEIALRYFAKIDNGDFDQEYFNMFSNDFRLESPKFGVKYGLDSLNEFGQKISVHYTGLKHIIAQDNVHVSNHLVFVEGILKGETKSGIVWPDNINSYGKFCSVLEFDQTKIKRISIYADPDFASEDKERLSLFK